MINVFQTQVATVPTPQQKTAEDVGPRTYRHETEGACIPDIW